MTIDDFAVASQYPLFTIAALHAIRLCCLLHCVSLALFTSYSRAFKAIRRAEVVVLLLDATSGLVDQDRILAQRIADEGRSCVIALNKWDAVPQKDDKTYLKAIEHVRQYLPVLRWAEVSEMEKEEGFAQA